MGFSGFQVSPGRWPSGPPGSDSPAVISLEDYSFNRLINSAKEIKGISKNLPILSFGEELKGEVKKN